MRRLIVIRNWAKAYSQLLGRFCAYRPRLWVCGHMAKGELHGCAKGACRLASEVLTNLQITQVKARKLRSSSPLLMTHGASEAGQTPRDTERLWFRT